MKGWIFDLDGTLVDSLPGIADALNAALREYIFPEHPEKIVRTFIGDGAEMLVRRALGDTHSSHMPLVLESFRFHYAKSWKHGTIPYNGVLETLYALRARGDKTAILSNKPHNFTADIAQVIFADLIDIALGENENTPHKPDPKGINTILEQWNFPPDQVCMVGDSVMDLQAAKNAGIPAVAVTWGYHDRDRLLAEQPQRIIDAMADLLD